MIEEGSEAAEPSYGRSAGRLSVAFGAAGALTYGFFAIGSHKLSVHEYGVLVALWAAVFISFSTICRPIEAYLSREISDAEARSQGLGRVLGEGSKVQGGMLAAFLVAVLVARGPIEDRLFDGSALFFWMFVLAVVGFSCDFFARGYLAGRRLFGVYSALLIFESGSRIVCAAALGLGLASGKDLAGIAVAVAPFGSLLPVFWLLGKQSRASRPEPPEPDPQARNVSAGAFTASVFVILLAEQTFVSLGPLLVKATDGGSAETGLIFNELVLAIAPLLLFQAVLATLLPHLTRLRHDESDQFDRSVRTTLQAVAAFAALAFVVVAAIGPPVMTLAFGDNLDYGRTGLLIITVGMGFYLAASTLNQAVLAHGWARQAAARWALCAALFVVWFALAPVGAVRAVETGFAGGAALLCALLALLQRRAAASNATTAAAI